jgi:hypothetical protein
LIGDLMFRSRIAETAKTLGVTVEFSVEPAPGDLVLLDLNAARFKPLETIEKLKGARVVAYAGHMQVDLLEKARALGATALTNGQFSAQLPQILRPC